MSPADPPTPGGGPSPAPVRALAAALGVADQRLRRILALALPIVGGMVSQNVLNVVDAAMVGRVPDANEALAGVGLGSFLNFLAGAFIMGLGSGVQAIASRRVGEQRLDECAFPLNGGLLLSVVVGVPLSVALVALAPRYFPLLVDDPAVAVVGVPYLQARLFALTAVGMNFSFRGFWNATDRSALYMGTLVVMHAANLFLNWVLIFGNLGAPALGAPGAGVASAMATALGTAVYVHLGLRHARPQGFLRGVPGVDTLRGIVRLSVPAGLQQSFFAAGMTVFLWIVGQVGTTEMAASYAILQLVLVAMLPALGFGLASASLVGQALGRGDPEEARRWGSDVVRIAALVVGVIALPAALWPEVPLSLLLQDPAALALAATPMRLVALTQAIDATGSVVMNSLHGAGDSRRVMGVATSLQWGMGLPLAWLLGPTLGLGLLGVWGANVAYRLVQAGVLGAIWRSGIWSRHEL